MRKYDFWVAENSETGEYAPAMRQVGTGARVISCHLLTSRKDARELARRLNEKGKPWQAIPVTVMDRPPIRKGASNG